MERWIDWMRSLGSRNARWHQLVQTAALQAQRPVWQQISPDVMEMGYFEARGYVRARAALVVADQVQILVATSGPLSPARQNLLHRAALQQVIVWAVAEAGRQRRSHHVARAA